MCRLMWSPVIGSAMWMVRPCWIKANTAIASSRMSVAATTPISVSNRACTPVQPELHLPNAFTPNADNINDRYYLSGIYIQQVDLKIFNRWGQKVFQGRHLDDAWDGTFEGKPVPEGVYVVTVDAVGNNGKRFYEKGTITLIR